MDLGLKDFAKTLGVLAIIIGLVVFLLAEVRDEVLTTNTYDTNNETHGAVTSVPYLLNTTNEPVVSDSESMYSWNTTSGNKIADLTKDTNYTVVSYEDGQFNITDLTTTGSDVKINITYQYTQQDPNNATDTIDEGISSLKDLAGWLPIIVIGVIASILVGFFGSRQFGRS